MKINFAGGFRLLISHDCIDEAKIETENRYENNPANPLKPPMHSDLRGCEGGESRPALSGMVRPSKSFSTFPVIPTRFPVSTQ